MSFDVLFEQLQRGKTIAEKDYLAADEDGWTITHILASRRVFPADFSYWGVADDQGTTVAHQAANYKKLPKDFNQWELSDKKGITVAHVAARQGILPFTNFPNEEQKRLLALTDSQGISVQDEVSAYNRKQIYKLKQILKSV